MTTAKPTTDTTGDDKAPDVLPQADDDAVDEASTRVSAQTGKDEVVPARAERAKPAEEDPRDVAARTYREMRDKRIAEAKGEAEPENQDADDDAAAETAEPVAVETKRKTISVDEIDPDAEIVLKVDGRELKRPFKDIVASAQIDAAANSRLEEAKRILSEAKAVAQLPRAPEHQPGADDETTVRQPSQSRATDQPEHQPDDEVDPEKLASIVERIQVGDKEEGQQALAELVKMVGTKPRFDQTDISRAVQQQLSERETASEIDRAVQGFAKDFPNLVSDDDLTNVTMTVITKELLRDLRSAGLSDSDLAAASKDTKRLAFMHRQARASGAKLRTYDGLLRDVGTHVSEKFGIRPGSAPTDKSQEPSQKPPQRAATDPAKVQERIERKRAAPQQPRTAGGRTPMAEAPRPKTKAEIVAEARRARGFRA